MSPTLTPTFLQSLFVAAPTLLWGGRSLHEVFMLIRLLVSVSDLNLSSLRLLLQLHAVPPLPGPWRLGGVAPDLILLLLLSGRPPAATLPPSPDQRQQRGPQPHLLSRRLRRPGRPVQRRALSRWRRRLWGPLWPGLLVPGHQQQRPHSAAHPQEGRTGGPPRCHPGSPGTQAAQHAAGQEETVGVSTDHFLLPEIAVWESPGYVIGLHSAI